MIWLTTLLILLSATFVAIDMVPQAIAVAVILVLVWIGYDIRMR